MLARQAQGELALQQLHRAFQRRRQQPMLANTLSFVRSLLGRLAL